MKNNRGLAAEMAVVTMLTVAALCMVLLVVAQLMQKIAVKDYTSIVAAAEADQVAEDFVAIMTDEDFVTFDKYAFAENYPEFEGNIHFEQTGNETDEKLITLTVTHPSRALEVTVRVRRKNYDGVWKTELVSWRRRAL